jgi:hypothetical protein
MNHSLPCQRGGTAPHRKQSIECSRHVLPSIISLKLPRERRCLLPPGCSSVCVSGAMATLSCRCFSHRGFERSSHFFVCVDIHKSVIGCVHWDKTKPGKSEQASQRPSKSDGVSRTIRAVTSTRVAHARVVTHARVVHARVASCAGALLCAKEKKNEITMFARLGLLFSCKNTSSVRKMIKHRRPMFETLVQTGSSLVYTQHWLYRTWCTFVWWCCCGAPWHRTEWIRKLLPGIDRWHAGHMTWASCSDMVCKHASRDARRSTSCQISLPGNCCRQMKKTEVCLSCGQFFWIPVRFC